VVEPAADVEGGGGVRRRRLVVAAPWVLGLVAVGAVQAVRAQWLDAVFVDRVARVALVVFWWWLGWHFLVAQTVDP
jgi:hypothetical protein